MVHIRIAITIGSLIGSQLLRILRFASALLQPRRDKEKTEGVR